MPKGRTIAERTVQLCAILLANDLPYIGPKLSLLGLLVSNTTRFLAHLRYLLKQFLAT